VFEKLTELVLAPVTVYVPFKVKGKNPATEILDPTGNGTNDCAVKFIVTVNPLLVTEVGVTCAVKFIVTVDPVALIVLGITLVGSVANKGIL
jgi:hypothetical protein